jgi:hydroxymethylglutaryl-CoA reductase (NADPH)
LATVGAPQRDLAELLCFVLGPDVDAPEVEQFVDLHRRHLGDATGGTIDRTRWHQGFQASLCDLMLNRLPMYALVHRIRRQTFLPRVVRTWRRLYELYPLA